jgi:uncharacterized membrane protein
MNKSRLEAFSDGVIAIIITIMVLEMKVPHGADWADLHRLWPVFVSYVLSFVFIGIYWANHHHLIHLVKRVTARVMWANLHLLFWMSLVPFVTAWMGENHFAQNPVALYGGVAFMSGVAYDMLVKAIRAANHEEHLFGERPSAFHKGNYSLVLYALACAAAYWHTGISFAIFVAVAIMWFIPDKRIEKIVSESSFSK